MAAVRYPFDGDEKKSDEFQPRFMLIELLVVIAVAEILAAMLLPVPRQVRERAGATACVRPAAFRRDPIPGEPADRPLRRARCGRR